MYYKKLYQSENAWGDGSSLASCHIRKQKPSSLLVVKELLRAVRTTFYPTILTICPLTFYNLFDVEDFNYLSNRNMSYCLPVEFAYQVIVATQCKLCILIPNIFAPSFQDLISRPFGILYICSRVLNRLQTHPSPSIAGQEAIPFTPPLFTSSQLPDTLFTTLSLHWLRNTFHHG